MHYADLGPYFKLTDVNEEKKARMSAAKSKRQTFKGRNHLEEKWLVVSDDIQGKPLALSLCD